jgi:hypothetical protein
MAGKYNDSKINEDETFFLSRNDLINRWGNIVSSWSMLPGLVGFWPMSSVQRSTGNAYEISGQGRTLTYTGNPTYNIYNNFVPYIDFDGVGDYLSRADETDLDVLGTEATNAAAVRGLTWGGWFWFDVGGALYGLIGKWNSNAVNQRSYLIYKSATEFINVLVSTDGIAAVSATTVTALTSSNWYFIVGRYIPSVSIDAYVNSNMKVTQAVGIPASIFNSIANFNIGAYSNGVNGQMDGRATLCFLSHQAYSDALINAMFQQSRILFGV